MKTIIKTFRWEYLTFSRVYYNDTYVSSTVTGAIPRVFLFKTDLPFDDAEKICEWIYKSIKKGVLVIPECVEFIGVEDLFKTEKIE